MLFIAPIKETALIVYDCRQMYFESWKYMFPRRSLAYYKYMIFFFFCRYIWGSCPPPPPNTKNLATLLHVCKRRVCIHVYKLGDLAYNLLQICRNFLITLQQGRRSGLWGGGGGGGGGTNTFSPTAASPKKADEGGGGGGGGTPTLCYPERHLRRKSRKSKCVGLTPVIILDYPRPHHKIVPKIP